MVGGVVGRPNPPAPFPVREGGAWCRNGIFLAERGTVALSVELQVMGQRLFGAGAFDWLGGCFLPPCFEYFALRLGRI